ncbi:MAG: transposase [Bradyrhizobium sp.]
MARKDEVSKRLMTVSGVGPIVSLLFKATINDPNRFKDSKAVAAHLGLTPRIYQSGEIDRSGYVSKCGDKLMRRAHFEAANARLRRSQKWSVLRAWGVKLAKRIGAKKRASRSPASLQLSRIAGGLTRPTSGSGN